LLVWSAFAGLAQSGKPVFDVARRERELVGVRRQIAELKTQLALVKEREQGLERELALVETELKLQESRLEEAVKALELATGLELEAEGRAAALEKELERIRGDLRRRLAGLYFLGRQGYLRIFFSLEPDRADRDVLPAIRQLRFLVLRNQRTLERFQVVKAELDSQRERVATHRREVSSWRDQEAARRDELAAFRTRRAEVLAKVATERRELDSQTAALEERAQGLARFINALITNDSSALAGTPLQNFRGGLDWPLAGTVRVPFGPRRDPRYRTEVPHRGIEIVTTPGAYVRAVFPGEVMYASLFEGYGPMVVIGHPGKVYTLSAGLERLNVRKGDMVSLGDVVGVSADSLYFEIRVDNEPQDPERWLQKLPP
jgi:septal ring factor EnvC (AmiA/AmiB activator)